MFTYLRQDHDGSDVYDLLCDDCARRNWCEKETGSREWEYLRDDYLQALHSDLYENEVLSVSVDEFKKSLRNWENVGNICEHIAR